ncbi:MAG TPA: GAF domain-containing protein [Solirubrobacteraceae bacterium]|nr:GAF domain-containing protein [Solirubrobacteraceae bacterium]
MTSNAPARTTLDRERVLDERSIERVSSIGPAARAVLHAARGVLADLDLERVLEGLVESARELTGARYGALGVLDESGTSLARFITAGIDASTRAGIGPLPAGHGVLGELRLGRGPVRVSSIGAHPRSYGFPAAHPTGSTADRSSRPRTSGCSRPSP